MADRYELYRNLLDYPEAEVESVDTHFEIPQPLQVREVCNALGRGNSVSGFTYSSETQTLSWNEEQISFCSGLQRLEQIFQPDHPTFLASYRYPMTQRSLSIGRELGSGAFGRVYQSVYDGLNVAVKTIRVSAETIPFNEPAILCRLEHPNLLTAIDCIPFYDNSVLSGINLVLPLADIDLFDEIKQRIQDKNISYDWLLQISRDILNGILYLQDHLIWHRDLKPENILLVNQQAVISDFGSAIGPECRIFESVYRYPGTAQYTSIELMLGDYRFNPSSDLWSVGCILAELITFQSIYPKDKSLHLQKIGIDLGDPMLTWPTVTSLRKWNLASHLFITDTGIPESTGSLRNRLRRHNRCPQLPSWYLDLIVGLIAYPPNRFTPEQIRNLVPGLDTSQHLCQTQSSRCFDQLIDSTRFPGHDIGILGLTQSLEWMLTRSQIVQIQNCFDLEQLYPNLWYLARVDLILSYLFRNNIPVTSRHFQAAVGIAGGLLYIDIEPIPTRHPLSTYLTEVDTIIKASRFDIRLVTWESYLNESIRGGRAYRIASFLINIGISYRYSPTQVAAGLTSLVRYYRRKPYRPHLLTELGIQFRDLCLQAYSEAEMEAVIESES